MTSYRLGELYKIRNKSGTSYILPINNSEYNVEERFQQFFFGKTDAQKRLDKWQDNDMDPDHPDYMRLYSFLELIQIDENMCERFSDLIVYNPYYNLFKEMENTSKVLTEKQNEGVMNEKDTLLKDWISKFPQL